MRKSVQGGICIHINTEGASREAASSTALPALCRVGLVATAAAATAAAAPVVVQGVAAGLQGHAAGCGVAALRGWAAHRRLAALRAAGAAHGVVIPTAASTASTGHVGSRVGKAGRNRDSV